MYKGAVASLRELKTEIEGLQDELKRSQAGLQRDFQRWHDAAMAEARGARSGGGMGMGMGTGTGMGTGMGMGVKRGGGMSACTTGGGAREQRMAAACRDRTNNDGTTLVELS